MDCITATLQDHYISGLKAKAKSIRRYIRTCFINDSDHAKRYPFLSDEQSIRTFFHPDYLTDRILQRYQLLQTFCHSLNSFRCKKKSVYQSFRHIVLFSILHINSIGFDQLICTFHKMFRNCRKHLVLFVCGYGPQHIFSFFCILSKL